MSQYHFDYSLSLYNSDDEDIYMENQYNQMEDSDIKCNFCNGFGHTISHCVSACSLGQSLHLKGIEVRQFDLEMECSGNSVKDWVEKLTFMQIIVLAQRIQLIAYTNSLWERGMINEDTSFLRIREDYNISLRFFYYFEPTGENFYKKLDFHIGLLETKDINPTFDCPICLEDALEVKKIVLFNCSHKVCYSCFHNYLTCNNFNKVEKPKCFLCRCTLKNAEISDINNLNDCKSKFNYN